MKKCVIPFLLFMLTLRLAAAQSLSLSSSVDNQRPEVGDVITLTLNLRVNNPQKQVDLNSYFPKIDSIPDFKIVRVDTGNQSSNVRIINGRRSSSYSVNRAYQIVPQKEGRLKIPAFSAVMNNQKANSKKIPVVVSKSTRSDLNALLPGAKIIHPYSNNTQINTLLKQGHIFLQPVLKRKKFYTGENIKMSYQLYVSDYFWDLWRKKQQLSLGIAQGNVFKNFHLLYQTDHSSYNPTFAKKKLGSKNYYYTTINEVVLQPLKLGRQTIPGWYLNGQFRRYFNTFSIPTAPLEFETMSLPPAKNLQGFNGAIGDFKFSAELDKNKIKQSEIIALRMKISGEGNLQRIEGFELPSLPQFELYGKVKRVADSRPQGKYKGDLIFEAVLRPREAGSLQIPAIPFSWFDPDKKKYITLKSKPLPLEVAPVQAAVAFSPNMPIINPENTNRILVLNEDIRYIMTDNFAGNRKSAVFIQRIGFWGIQALPLLLIFGSIYVRHQREKLQGDSGLARRRGAKGLVGKRLKSARKILRENQPEKLYIELSRCLRGYLSNQFNVADHGLTADELVTLLNQHDLSEELVQRTNEYLLACDTANYAPGSDSPERMKQMVEQVGELISKLDKEIK